MFALVWKIGMAGSGQRPLDQPHAEPARVLPAGQRIAAVGVGDHGGHRARQQGAER